MTVTIPGKSQAMNEFIEKLKGKIRDDIASMLPEDVIQTMAMQVLKDEFLTKKKKDIGDRWNSKIVDCPSEFQEMVIEASKPILEKIIKEYVEENKEVLKQQAIEIINTGLMRLIVNFLQGNIAQVMQDNSNLIALAVKDHLARGY